MAQSFSLPILFSTPISLLLSLTDDIGEILSCQVYMPHVFFAKGKFHDRILKIRSPGIQYYWQSSL